MNDTMKIIWTVALAALLILAIDTYRRVRSIERHVTNIALQLDAVPSAEGSLGESALVEDEAAVDVMPDLMDDVSKEA